LNSAHFTLQCSLVIYLVQNFLIDDFRLILILKNVVKCAGHGCSSEPY